MTAFASQPNEPLMALAVEQLRTDTQSLEARWQALTPDERAEQVRTYRSVRETLAGRLHPYFRILSSASLAGVSVGLPA